MSFLSLTLKRQADDDRAERVEKSLRPLYQADAYIFVILQAPQVVVCAIILLCVKKWGSPIQAFPLRRFLL